MMAESPTMGSEQQEEEHLDRKEAGRRSADLDLNLELTKDAHETDEDDYHSLAAKGDRGRDEADFDFNGVQKQILSQLSEDMKRSPPPKKSSSPSGNRSPSPVQRASRSPNIESPARKRRPFLSPRRGSHSPARRRSSSPRRKDTSPVDGGRRRHYREKSRSPVGRSGRVASPYGRDYRRRSRSRSPPQRDYRRSPRSRYSLHGRYSPKRRGSPRFRSRGGRSPRRRPWSPPPNRSTGEGKPGNNLFIAGFGFVTTERDLEKKFSRFGHVTDVRIVRDKRSGDSRGFGFLSLERDEDADAAIRALDQTEWNGRVVLVEKAKTSTRY